MRLALSGQLGKEALASSDVAEALKLCVSCKACRRECPTGVDMAKMKIEATAARAARHGIGLRERLVADLPRYAPLAASFPGAANLRNKVPLLRRFLDRTSRPCRAARSADLAVRSFPRPRGLALRRRRTLAMGDVMLFADTFNRYFEPENLRAALQVIAAGWTKPVLPRHDGRPLCCGGPILRRA